MFHTAGRNIYILFWVKGGGDCPEEARDVWRKRDGDDGGTWTKEERKKKILISIGKTNKLNQILKAIFIFCWFFC